MPLALERHATKLYTLSIFYELQIEIVVGCFFCRVVSIRKEQGLFWYDIKGGCNTVYSVQHKAGGLSAECNCNLFKKLGLV